MKSMTRPIPMLIWGLILFCIVGICLALGRASGANVELGPSVQFSEEELRGAVHCVKRDFRVRFTGGELLQLRYDEALSDQAVDDYLARTEDGDADAAEGNIIALFADFKTGERTSGGLNPNAVYRGFGYMLARSDADGKWEIIETGW
mgnify:FL=1